MDHRQRLRDISVEIEAAYGFGIPWNIPTYVPGVSGEWSIRRRPGGVTETYLSRSAVEPEHAVMSRGGEVWMSNGMLELESHAWHLHCARGNVLVAGLGMGMFAHAAAAKPEVRRVVVVERDPDVITLMKQATDFSDWEHRHKIHIVEGDALAVESAASVEEAFAGLRPDYLYADIWPVFPDPAAPGHTRRMTEIFRPMRAGWWGQELEFGLWLNSIHEEPSMESLAAFFHHHGVDAAGSAGYVAFCEDVMEVHLRPENDLQIADGHGRFVPPFGP